MNRSGLYKTWLGVNFLKDRPNRYELLGLNAGEQDQEKIIMASDSAIARLKSVQPRAGQIEAWAEMIDELYQAKTCLTDAQAKVHYDAGLQAAARQPAAPNPMAPAAPMAAAPMAAAPMAADPMAAAGPILTPALQLSSNQPVVARPVAAAQPVVGQPLTANPVVARPVVARPVAVAQAAPVAVQPKPVGPQVKASRSATKIARQRARKKSPVLALAIMTLLFVGGGIVGVQYLVGDSKPKPVVQNLAPLQPVRRTKISVVAKPRKVRTQRRQNRDIVEDAFSGGFNEADASGRSLEGGSGSSLEGGSGSSLEGGSGSSPDSEPAVPAMPDKGSAPKPSEPSSSSAPASSSTPEPTDSDRKQVAEAIGQARAAIAASKWNDAQQFLTAVEKTPKTSDDAAQHQRLATLVRYRIALADAVERGYKTLKAGEKLPLRSTSVEVVEVGPEHLKIKVGGAVKRYPAGALRPGLALAVALSTVKEDQVRASLFKSVFYATHVDPNYKQARSELEAIVSSSDDARHLLDYLNAEHPASESSSNAAPAMAKTGPSPKPASEPETPSLGATFQAARAALTARDIALANELLEKAEAMEQTDEQKAMYNRLKQLAHFAGAYWSAVSKGVDGLKDNDEIMMSGELVMVVSSTPDELIIRARGRNFTINRAEPLPETLAYAMAVRWLKQDDPISAVTLGAFYATAQKPDFGEARRLWGLAARAGADIGDLALVLRDRYKF